MTKKYCHACGVPLDGSAERCQSCGALAPSTAGRPAEPADDPRARGDGASDGDNARGSAGSRSSDGDVRQTQEDDVRRKVRASLGRIAATQQLDPVEQDELFGTTTGDEESPNAEALARRAAKKRYAGLDTTQVVSDQIQLGDGTRPRLDTTAEASRVLSAGPTVLEADAVPPVIDREEAETVPVEPRRRNPFVERTVPLTVVIAVAVLAIFGISRRSMPEGRAEQAAGTSVGSASEETVALPAAEVPFGLTEENKEAVINLCLRVSSNPNHECRRSRLTATGEYPAQTVEIPPLTVDKLEISNARYEGCVEQGSCAARDWESCRFYTQGGWQIGREVPEEMRSPAMPAVCVTWTEAETFCAARGMRLPTPREWERVARAGTDRLLPWGVHWAPGLLNWGEVDMGGFPIAGRLDGAALTAAADSFEHGATPDGVRNTLGNVAEWVAPSSLDESSNIEVPAGVRGGSYVDHVGNLRLTRHTTLAKSERRSTVGFRCVEGGSGPADGAP